MRLTTCLSCSLLLSPPSNTMLSLKKENFLFLKLTLQVFFFMALFSFKQLHIWLLKLNEMKFKFSSSFVLLTFQGLNSHMWLVATELDSIHMQCFHHHRKIYWASWNRLFQYTVASQRFESPLEILPTLILRCT